jgi:hypothetical protein
MANQPALYPFVMSTIDGIMSACDKAEMDKEMGKTGEGVSVLGKKPRDGG